MKVEKDLRETDGVQDERRNGKTGGNSARSFAVLTLCAVLAMVISLGTRTFAESEGGRVYAASDGGEGSPYEEVAVPTGIALPGVPAQPFATGLYPPYPVPMRCPLRPKSAGRQGRPWQL